ncbi:helix-turn-helix transcriptional regulator [Desulfitobacterium sp.]|uniref:helix-turn-helix domain-containing protein n=1 Tax=Desulfitobacterium sp. TaxID=49981 RepID=UPI002B203BD9|nr:helix-turn-helix transcriptional regulator [Desulfitobacterium sp.]MEA4903051.1 helix-turn-helix transcriptional regulator [Desulfitobacterium sp.]
MDNLKNIASKNIIYLRKRSQMTQLELGEKLNYSDKAISKWERAEAIPDAYILKQMSELFHVSVDYILTDHSNEEETPETPAPLRYYNHMTIKKITIVGIWTLAILIFTIFWALGYREWLIFVYTLPISLIVLLVLNSIWGNRKNNFYIISGLVWSIIAAIYLSFFKYNLWLLFILGIPSEMIIYLSFKIPQE